MQQIDLSFVESQMYSAISSATPEQQADLRRLAATQSLAEFTRTLQQRFAQYASHITEPRVANVLAYDRLHQAPAPDPATAQSQPVPQPAPMPAPAPAAPKVAREEMWWIMLAKSKTMRFFSVSCEFIIFLGCLWLTLVTIEPTATSGDIGGAINTFFLVAMGFAVDAALPEAWLHVVDQFITKPRKHSQLKWSVPVAVGMLLLVVANFVYAKLGDPNGGIPTDAMQALINTLLIARMFIGISYVTIRECQSFIDRKQASLKPALPNMPDVQQMIDQALAGQQAKVEQRLAGISTEQGRMVASLQQLQNTPATVPQIDVEAIVSEVTARIETQLQAKLRQIDAQMRQSVRVSPVVETGQHETKTLVSAKQAVSPNIVPLPAPRSLRQRNPSQDADVEATIIRLLDQDKSYTVRALAQLANTSTATAGRIRKAYFETIDQAISADETASVS